MEENEAKKKQQERSETPTIIPDTQKTVRRIWGDILEGANSEQATIKSRLAERSGRATAMVGGAAEAKKGGTEGRGEDFRILDVIGEGGMGVVYNAKQISLDREVALKVLKDVRGTERSIIETSFASEAVVTGNLEHPNIVPVYTLQEDARGKTFYTMKKVAGRAWQSSMDDMTLDENLEVLLRVCDAVAFSHSRGIIHRDLKPDNVMLGDYGEVLLMDWGLAAPLPGETDIDMGGSVPFGGTPAYMSPEMALNKQDRVGKCSDIYLLGGILYRLITGLTPHSGKSPFECITAAAENKIQPTDKKGELTDIALKAMSAFPEDRYQSVEEFQEAIRAYRAHAQSIKLAEEAMELLRCARETKDNDTFTRAIYGFQSALSLWQGNSQAQQGQVQARTAYAQSAYEKGDFDLALSLLDEERSEHLPLRQMILNARAERIRRRKAVRTLRAAAVALASALVVALTVGFFWIRAERDTALREGYFTTIGLAAKKIEGLRFDKAEELLQSCPKRLRHWEWGRLKYLCNLSLLTFGGHSSQVEAVAFSPDGKRIASGSWAGTIKIWFSDTGREHLTLRGHTDVVCSLAFSPDGKALASASDDGTVKLWDAGTGREMRTLKGHSGEVWCVAFSPDGRTVVSGGSDRTLRRWSVEAQGPPVVLKGDWGPVTSVAFSPDGRYLTWGTGEPLMSGLVYVRGIEAGSPLTPLQGHTDRVDCVAFSPDGKVVVSGSWDGTVRLWDARSGASVGILRGHSGPVHCVAFSPDGAWLASGSDDSTVKRWDIKGTRRITTFKGHSGAVGGLCVSPDGRRIASASVDGTVKLWDVEHIKPEARILAGHKKPITSVTFSPDGTTLASASEDGTIRLWDLAAEGGLRTLEAGRDTVSSVAFSPDGKRLASGNWDHTVTLWDVRTGKVTAVLEGHKAEVRDVQFSPDGKLVASAGWDGTVKIRDAASGEEMQSFEGHKAEVQCVAFSPDGRRVASCAKDNTVRVWDVRTGREIATLRGHTHWVRAVAYSPDGRLIASAGDDNLVKLWDARKGTPVATLKGHTNWVKSVAFSPDGKRLISAGDDKVVRIWDVGTGRELIALKGHSMFIWSVAFSPDGRLIASGGGDCTVRIWDASEWK